MTENKKLAKEAIKLAEREIKEWTKFLKIAKEILEEEITTKDEKYVSRYINVPK
jgi:hypothetical protein